MIKYTESHEWVRLEGEIAVVGITKHAKNELGEIVFAELPEIDSKLNAGDEVAVLESTKAAADVYSPISGDVIEVNEDLIDDLVKINESPESSGWIYKIRLTKEEELEKLMDQDSYEKLIG